MPRKLLIIFYVSLLVCALILSLVTWKTNQRASVIVEWSTASEIDTAGYNLYRRDDTTVSDIQVNSELIPAFGDPFTGSDYSFKDSGLESGKTYTYTLEEVENDGGINRNGEIVVGAKSGGLLEYALAGVLGMISIVGLLFVIRS